jgi:hypothetical protein
MCGVVPSIHFFWKNKAYLGRMEPKLETIMRWCHYLAYFFGGPFLANALPHLGNGISGHAFQSPFATPPGVGLSSSTVNVLWGLFNLAVGYLLVCRVGNFELRKTRHVLVLGGASWSFRSCSLMHSAGSTEGCESWYKVFLQC